MEWKRWGRWGLVALLFTYSIVADASAVSEGHVGLKGRARTFNLNNAKLYFGEIYTSNFKLIWGKVTIFNDKTSMKAFMGKGKIWEFKDNCSVVKKYFPIYVDKDFLLVYCSNSTDLFYNYVKKTSGKVLTIRGYPIFRDDLYVYYISALSFDDPAIIRRFAISGYSDEYFLKIRLMTYANDCSDKKNYGRDLLRFYKVIDSVMTFRSIGKLCNFQQEISMNGKTLYSGRER